MELRIGNYTVTTHRNGYRCHGIPGTDAEGLSFSLWERDPGTWRVSWQQSERRFRRQVTAFDLGEAVYEAEKVFNPTARGEHFIEDVFKTWKETLTCSEDTRERDYGARAVLFAQWCAVHGVRRWSELRMEHVQKYIRECSGLSQNTVRKRLNPIRRAAKWAALNWRGRYHDFTEGVEITGRRPERPSEWWSFGQVFRFLNYCRTRDHGWNLIPGIALTGFCSLRVKEAIRLRWDDFDGETVFVSGKKTDLSERLIPVPEIVRLVLADAPRTGDRILSAYQDIWSYGQAFTRYAVKRKRGRIEPKGLRRTVPSEFMRRGLYGDMMRLYRGHKPEGISRVDLEHYAVMDEDWLLKQLKAQVVDKIDAATVNLCRYWRGRDSGKVVRLR